MNNQIPVTLEDRILWGAKSIALFLGCDDQFVRRTLLTDPDCPVQKIGKRLFARSDELESWTRFSSLKKPNKAA